MMITMMMIERRIIIFLLMIAALTDIALAATIPPAPTNDIYVADYASMIERVDKNKMLQMGGVLDKKYRAQIVAVTVDTLDGETIEDYANRLFNTWGIGDLIKNNGVLILIAKNDRQFRIEVGHGLESSITNDYAASVLDGMRDQFRAENYSTAILNAYGQLARKIYEHYNDTPPEDLNEIAAPEEELTWGETAFGIFCIGSFACSLILVVRGVIKKLKSSFETPDDPVRTYRDRWNERNDDDDHYGGGSSGGGGASGGW